MYNKMAKGGMEMDFDLTRVKNKIEEEIEIDHEYEIDSNLISGTDLLEPLKIFLKGKITRDVLEGFLLDVEVTGTMMLPCSITLKPVSVPLDIHITGNLDELMEEIDENHKKIENSIDILPIIWENILMEIPMKVTSPDAYSVKTEGEGWKFVTDEMDAKNPALEKLKDLL